MCTGGRQERRGGGEEAAPVEEARGPTIAQEQVRPLHCMVPIVDNKGHDGVEEALMLGDDLVYDALDESRGAHRGGQEDDPFRRRAHTSARDGRRKVSGRAPMRRPRMALIQPQHQVDSAEFNGGGRQKEGDVPFIHTPQPVIHEASDKRSRELLLQSTECRLQGEADKERARHIALLYALTAVDGLDAPVLHRVPQWRSYAVELPNCKEAAEAVSEHPAGTQEPHHYNALGTPHTVSGHTRGHHGAGSRWHHRAHSMTHSLTWCHCTAERPLL
ncbi:unnamed protein product [Vitrella brassicaformis CCMP3155]|uniref:Uncharacterized protein n=1 Tax=Vitrella brassicaformis (strain CCMP3155) TaxID=1169540 RepID=A0A0G4FET6_VITBC|nr:unnamed protein product [Vitrella brassicaformis CCMP3155]|eukprot:CEM11512.1 unnamed protein product [Vitrella brassicaformis CCMP3155]